MNNPIGVSPIVFHGYPNLNISREQEEVIAEQLFPTKDELRMEELKPKKRYCENDSILEKKYEDFIDYMIDTFKINTYNRPILSILMMDLHRLKWTVKENPITTKVVLATCAIATAVFFCQKAQLLHKQHS
jgi:hypothetical protein